MSSPDGTDPWPAPDELERDPWAVFVAGSPVSGRELAQHWAARTATALRLPAAVVVAFVLSAAPIGLAWARLSPRVSVSFSAQGPTLEQPESNQFFTVDSSLLIWLLVAGLIAGAVAWRFLRHVGARVAGGLAVGGVLMGVVSHAVAVRVVVDERLSRLCSSGACDVYDGTQPVRALVFRLFVGSAFETGPIYLGGIACAVAALVTLVVLTLFFDREPAGVS
ncbi:MAG TPA: hypothetical protein VNA12_02265 [Mycobacteriales bacterium]|nr:hypothetical protein [Mycobacteriales bacterium]